MRPEPEWWAEARHLRAQGLPYDQIGHRLGKSHGAVRYAVDPEARKVEVERKAAERFAGRGQRSGEPYSREELERALKLHEKDSLPWSVVAQRLGRSESSLKVNVCRYRKGRKFMWEIWTQESEQLAELAFSGLSLGEIARRRGCHASNIWQRLQRIGVDQEIIQQEREERKLAA